MLKATIAENYGKNYIVKLIKTIKGIPVSSVREYIIDILLAFVVSFPAESQVWYQEALTPVFLIFVNKIKFYFKLSNDILTPNEKNKIIENIAHLQIKELKEDLIHLQTRSGFVLFCRNFLFIKKY